MHRNTKLVTCCYCGTRAALVLNRGHHVLVCSSCGAPLGELKQMPVERAVPPPEDPRHFRQHIARKPKKTCRKRRKPGFGHLARRIFNEIEDIFD
ncbi:hypothetical protein [Tropicimonas sp.]|uniref:hypothetical protein n=1 Tax=Tropicimonas sp. TaxID=2067044 RepID=UPI003A87EFEA